MLNVNQGKYAAFLPHLAGKPFGTLFEYIINE